jgi:putative transposase
MISMDGKGRCMDNIFVERLWRSLKYEEVYLHAYATVAEAKASIGAWVSFYNEEHQHQSLGYRTPRQIYQEGLWIYGRSALPTGYASPASRASSESGEMLAFAHIPTGAATNHGFDIDQVNSRPVKSAVASMRLEPTSKPAGLHLNNRLRLSHDRGPSNISSMNIDPYWLFGLAYNKMR